MRTDGRVATGNGSREAARFREALAAWYRDHGRHGLPWRQTRDPYRVLVSEVMLQQTQVERVLPYYERWVARWPSPRELAAAETAEVIREWAGLGYNRRAVYLQRAAQAACERHGGQIPTDEAALRDLPGVGPYTAAAVACFADGANVVVADTNIARVAARTMLGAANHREAGAGPVHAALQALLPRVGARDHNLALMDLGAMVCAARSPDCELCPIAGMCRWRLAGRPAPVTNRAASVRFEDTARFARGRLVDALRRHAGLSAAELAELLPEQHRDAVPRYLFALEREGLVEQEDGRWRLPGASADQGSSSMASPKL